MLFIGPDIKQVNSFEIFDRWGTKVFSGTNFSSNGTENSCDGKYNGNFVGVGIYIYVVQIEFLSGQVEKKAGSIDIIQ